MSCGEKTNFMLLSLKVTILKISCNRSVYSYLLIINAQNKFVFIKIEIFLNGWFALKL
jgi:hypothetical protein